MEYSELGGYEKRSGEVGSPSMWSDGTDWMAGSRAPSRQEERFSIGCKVLAIALFSALATTIEAKPRAMQPPWPSPGQIYHEGFDEPFFMPTNVVPDPSIWTESWSGWALNRSRESHKAVPWAVPMLATSGSWNLDPERGALRLWYRPDYDSGSGPGHLARLMTLVSARDKTVATWWSLVISRDGACVQLLCETANGPAACASAPVAFQAGSWHLITLGYTETNCALFIDDQEVAEGGGLMTVPSDAAPFTGLLIGSGLSGEVAAGEIEEFAAFTGRTQLPREPASPFGIDPLWEIQGCWVRLSSVAQLGSITPEEEAAMRKRCWSASRHNWPPNKPRISRPPTRCSVWTGAGSISPT